MISLLQIFADPIREALIQQNIQLNKLQEIRIRIGNPVLLLYENKERFLKLQNHQIIASKEMLRETMEYISGYSLYAFEEELRQGFLTIEGGHRVGVAGKVLIENGKIKNIQHISSINIRIAHEMIGCADRLFPWILGEQQICHTLIISPPSCGKTTLLRDLIRQISDGNDYMKGTTVGVVDERAEIGGCYMGVPQNRLGIRTDILDCCPKAEGMLLLIRSMAPKVIAVDEIGAVSDVEAMEYAMHCGCKLLATVHGKSLEEVKKRPVIGEYISMENFERYIILSGYPKAGTIQKIYDKSGNILVDFWQ